MIIRGIIIPAVFTGLLGKLGKLKIYHSAINIGKAHLQEIRTGNQKLAMPISNTVFPPSSVDS